MGWAETGNLRAALVQVTRPRLAAGLLLSRDKFASGCHWLWAAGTPARSTRTTARRTFLRLKSNFVEESPE